MGLAGLAACRGMDVEIFFHPYDDERRSDRQHRIDHAKSICHTCPVVDQCRDHALATLNPTESGVGCQRGSGPCCSGFGRCATQAPERQRPPFDASRRHRGDAANRPARAAPSRSGGAAVRIGSGSSDRNRPPPILASVPATRNLTPHFAVHQLRSAQGVAITSSHPNDQPRAAAVVLAAGSGTRFGAEQSKVFLPLAGRRVFTWSLRSFASVRSVRRLILVIREIDRDLAEKTLEREVDSDIRVEIVIGGDTATTPNWPPCVTWRRTSSRGRSTSFCCTTGPAR